jgi:hypothetical protein
MDAELERSIEIPVELFGLGDLSEQVHLARKRGLFLLVERCSARRNECSDCLRRLRCARRLYGDPLFSFVQGWRA